MNAKISCQVIEDLLPLYVDDVVSADTKKLVEEHLAACPECLKKAERMKEEIKIETGRKAAEVEAKALKDAKRKLRKKKMGAVVISAVCVAAVLIGAYLAFNLIRIPIAFDKESMSLDVQKDTRVELLDVEYTGKLSGTWGGQFTDPNGREIFVGGFYNTPASLMFGDEKEQFSCRFNTNDYDNLDAVYYCNSNRSYIALKKYLEEYGEMPEDCVLLCERDNGTLRFTTSATYHIRERE